MGMETATEIHLTAYEYAYILYKLVMDQINIADISQI